MASRDDLVHLAAELALADAEWRRACDVLARRRRRGQRGVGRQQAYVAACLTRVLELSLACDRARATGVQ